MAGERETVWTLDPHTQKKHAILKRYWDAWLPIMGSWNGRVLYVDGFAGPGQYKGGEDGSPLIVLKAARDHTYKVKAEVLFLFIERDKARAEHLERTIKALMPGLPANFKHEVVNGTFNNEMTSVLNYLDEQRKRLAPAFVFIDPFGFSHTPFKTIGRILQNPRSEVLVTFMYEEINRFLVHPDQPRNYDDLFGTEEWQKAAAIHETEKRRRFIHDLYLTQLRTLAKYVRSFEMLNKGNRTDYFLFFATNGLIGLEKMKEAMWKVAPTGDYQFSDYTDSLGVISLFGDKPDFGRLEKILHEQFRGNEVPIEAIEEFVVLETPFLKTHIKRGTLVPMEDQKKIEVVASKPGRRRGTFPPGTTVKFG
jgi:three-Cys-motif partner protein